MLSNIVLWVNALAFVGYGLQCFFFPGIPAQLIGYELTSGDANIEIVAMYGGLQIGVGLVCVLGALNPNFKLSALIAVALIVGGLAVGRVFGYMMNSDPITFYTIGTICFEPFATILAVICIKKELKAKQSISNASLT